MRLLRTKRAPTVDFINPLKSYWFERHRIAEDFPVSLPPDEDETSMASTLLLEAIQNRYKTQLIEERQKSEQKI